MPSALLRSAPSANVTEMIEKTDGARIAPAAPWSEAHRDEHPGGDREAAEEREEREEREPDHEEPAAPEQVAHAAAEEQEAAERERVAAHDPLEVLGREVEIAPGSTGSATFTIETSSTTIR